MDIVLMGLPQSASIELVEAALLRGVKVIDLSGAFRLRHAEEYARYYASPHPRPDLLARFVYGLPELNRTWQTSIKWHQSLSVRARRDTSRLMTMPTSRRATAATNRSKPSRCAAPRGLCDRLVGVENLNLGSLLQTSARMLAWSAEPALARLAPDASYYANPAVS